MHENLVPEISLGTHFFNDLVEMDMLYLAVYPQKYDNLLNNDFFMNQENLLKDFILEAEKWQSSVRVIDFPLGKNKQSMCIYADVLTQNSICYIQ